MRHIAIIAKEDAVQNQANAILSRAQKKHGTGGLVMTNGDKIRNMTNEELEDFLTTIIYSCKRCDCRCNECPVSGYEDTDGVCDMGDFLRKEIVGDME